MLFNCITIKNAFLGSTFMCIINIGFAQNLITYNSKISNSAKLTEFYMTKKEYNNYPITGVYSPTPWVSSNKFGVGYGSYIYLSTNNLIEPGIEYKISLKIKVFDSYNYSEFYKKHLGVAFTKYIINNPYEIWSEKIYHLDNLVTDSIFQVEFNFRPLCKPNYIVIGVFHSNGELNKKPCAFCSYKFELHDLLVSERMDGEENFEYVCNDFVFNNSNKILLNRIDTSLYFSLNEYTIDESYDSLFSKLKKVVTNQDLLILNSYTDKSGDKNLDLSKKRVESVVAKLIEVGIDSNQIISQIHGEKFSTQEINRNDRKVNIKKSEDKLFQRYYTEAMCALNRNDDHTAWKNLLLWLKNVTRNSAIYSLFDCWTIEIKNLKMKKRLEDRIKNRFYKNNNLSFSLDSLWCEDQKYRAINHYTVLNYTGDFNKTKCDFILDGKHQHRLELEADLIYNNMGFPSKEKCGTRGNDVIPFIVIHSDNLIYQKKYLPLFQKACEDKEIRWEMFALLWDKISLKEKGYQRYGTQFEVDSFGNILGLYKLENMNMTNEWRKQVGLDPLSD